MATSSTPSPAAPSPATSGRTEGARHHDDDRRGCRQLLLRRQRSPATSIRSSSASAGRGRGEGSRPGGRKRLQRTHVATERSDAAGRVLASKRAIALLGEPGSGRRSGIALLARLDATPQTSYSIEKTYAFPCPWRRRGYLLDLEESSVQLGPASASGSKILPTVARHRLLPSRTRPSPRLAWLGLDEHDLATVTIRAPQATAVFASHLKALENEFVATDWSGREAIVQHLSEARPRDAVHLPGSSTPSSSAGRRVSAAGRGTGGVRQLADELDHWFRNPEGDDDGRRRALLIATAALNNSSAGTVYRAADRLAEIVELPRAPAPHSSVRT